MRKSVALVAATLLLVAGCGGGASTSSPAASRAPSPTASAADSASASIGPTSMPGAVGVATAESDFGTILVDADGRTLYVFLNDTGTESTCYDQCAANWPPFVADGAVQPAEGLDVDAFDTTVRTEGARQVTFHGHPLYYYARDEAAGDTNGQAIGDVWYVVGPDGEPIR